MIHSQKITGWNDFGKSIFSEMTEQAIRENAINLAQGFPDFDSPEFIKQAASQAILKGKNQYAPSHGIKDLRAALAKHYKRNFNYEFNSEYEVTVFSGATEAIWCAVGSLCRPEDEVIILAPSFDIYPAAVFGAKANLVVHELTWPNWSLNIHDLEAKITKRTKAIILNNPMNPNGKVFTESELLSFAHLAIQHDLIVISDEVYDHLVFEPNQHISIHKLPGMRSRTVTISSAAKTFSVTGWKVGFAFACEELTQKIRSIHQFTVFCSATPLQWALAEAYEEQDDYVLNLKSDLMKKKTYLNSLLIEAGFAPHPCQAGYFITADFTALSDEDDFSFATNLIKAKKIAAIPLSAFYFGKAKTGLLRFAFCKKDQTLQSARLNFLGASGR